MTGRRDKATTGSCGKHMGEVRVWDTRAEGIKGSAGCSSGWEESRLSIGLHWRLQEEEDLPKPSA